ncbi:MAG: response regulator [Fimbriimonadaceae bacterium]|nr:response regulator [Fimbriimonadaceae bacterium]
MPPIVAGQRREVSVDPATPGVLIVDYHPLVGGVVAEGLGSLGHRAWYCSSAEAALACLAERPVGVVLAEVGLTCYDGEPFTRRLRQHYPDLPLALLTGWLDHPETTLGPHTTARLVLRKPVRLERLDLAVRALQLGWREV